MTMKVIEEGHEGSSSGEGEEEEEVVLKHGKNRVKKFKQNEQEQITID